MRKDEHRETRESISPLNISLPTPPCLPVSRSPVALHNVSNLPIPAYRSYFPPLCRVSVIRTPSVALRACIQFSKSGPFRLSSALLYPRRGRYHPLHAIVPFQLDQHQIRTTETNPIPARNIRREVRKICTRENYAPTVHRVLKRQAFHHPKKSTRSPIRLPQKVSNPVR